MNIANAPECDSALIRLSMPGDARLSAVAARFSYSGESRGCESGRALARESEQLSSTGEKLLLALRVM